MDEDLYDVRFSAKTVLLGEQARASSVETVELTTTVFSSYHIPSRGMLTFGAVQGGRGDSQDDVQYAGVATNTSVGKGLTPFL